MGPEWMGSEDRAASPMHRRRRDGKLGSGSSRIAGAWAMRRDPPTPSTLVPSGQAGICGPVLGFPHANRTLLSVPEKGRVLGNRGTEAQASQGIFAFPILALGQIREGRGNARPRKTRQYLRVLLVVSQSSRPAAVPLVS